LVFERQLFVKIATIASDDDDDNDDDDDDYDNVVTFMQTTR